MKITKASNRRRAPLPLAGEGKGEGEIDFHAEARRREEKEVRAMNSEHTIKALLAGARALAECKSARIAWVKRTAAAWREAHREMEDRCTEAVERLSEEAFERLCDAEEAKVEAIHAQLRAVIDKDMWPRELYFSGI
jgi:hypothetical protein